MPEDRTLFAYNLAQQLTRVTRPDGKTVDLGYDSGGRLKTITIPRGTTSYTYGGSTGNLTTITAPDGGTLGFAYNKDLLTATSWSGSVSGTVTRGYDTDRRITSLGVNGDTVSFTYDADGLLSQAGALNVSREAGSGLISGTGLGSVNTARTYNAFGELATEAATSGASTLYDVTHTRDKLGRITQKVETVQGQAVTTTYGYDLAGRLTTVTENGVTTTYSYDANGNRLTQTRGTQTTAGSYDDQDRLLAYGGATYSYTANGELLTKTEAGQTTSHVYDELGNLIQVTLPNGTVVEYVIDGQNRRIGKKVNGTLVQAFLYQDQLNPIAELDGSGNIVSRFIYGTKVNVPDYVVKAGTTYRIVSDHLGSPRLVINTTDGTVAQRMDYDEFGNVTTDTSPGFQPFGFAGGLYDRDTGLTRFGVRDYDSAVGRWSTKDPKRFQGGTGNIYTYVFSDPVNSIDPSGLDIPGLEFDVAGYRGGLFVDTGVDISRTLFEGINDFGVFFSRPESFPRLPEHILDFEGFKNVAGRAKLSAGIVHADDRAAFDADGLEFNMGLIVGDLSIKGELDRTSVRAGLALPIPTESNRIVHSGSIRDLIGGAKRAFQCLLR